jgi:hypothetical protein
MLLILTNSLDSTVDLLVEAAQQKPIFRFNVDLWADYQVHIDENHFSITDPTGREIDENSTKSCYWRKPRFDLVEAVPEGGSIDGWLKAQWTYVVREIWNVTRNAGKSRLVEAGAESRFGKVLQLRTASKYFNAPRWCFASSAVVPFWDASLITKAMNVEFVGEARILYTRKVDPTRLDTSYPWFLQSEVEASHDLTVVYVAGRCFGFTLDRKLFEGVDWRVDINRVDHPWEDYELGQDLTLRICAFMDEARLSYGRLDFLLKDGEAWFLEVNPNGQYAWLDENGQQGMMAAILEELTTDNPKKPIPPTIT